MKSTLRQTCRIGLLATLLAASSPGAGLAGLAGTLPEGGGNQFVFRVSATPLARNRGE